MNEIKTFKERKEELVKKGKENGYITYEQLADALKGLDLDADSLDDLYNAFSENNIAVLSESDDADDSSKLLLSDNELTKDLTINDPVRMYLKEIGQIKLLSLDEELELADRIKDFNTLDFKQLKNCILEAGGIVENYLTPYIDAPSKNSHGNRASLACHSELQLASYIIVVFKLKFF